MQDDIVELYPNHGLKHRLKELYLDQLDDVGRADGLPFIYTNYIASLDGRIALPGPGRATQQVPPAIANARDWRLFQELAAQADLLVTSARYFRQSANQEAQAELPLGTAHEFDDLREWRIHHGLAPQPDIAVFSSSLDIPESALNRYRDRKLFLVTGNEADPGRLQRLSENTAAQVVRCGNTRRVDGSLLRQRLAELGYQRVYAIAGSSVLHTLVSGRALDRLYLTTAHCLLGGSEFSTFVSGTEFSPAPCLTLKALYLDTLAPEGAGQTLGVFETQ